MREGRQRWKKRFGEGGFLEVFRAFRNQSANFFSLRTEEALFKSLIFFFNLNSLLLSLSLSLSFGEGPPSRAGLAAPPPPPLDEMSSRSQKRDPTPCLLTTRIEKSFQQKKNNNKTKKCRDAFETCDTLSGQGRASCFASFGIDSERVDAWYGPVSRLEAALNNSSHAGAGLCSFGDETEEEEEEEEEDFDGGDDGGDEGGGGFRWPSLPGMPRW